MAIAGETPIRSADCSQSLSLGIVADSASIASHTPHKPSPTQSPDSHSQGTASGASVVGRTKHESLQNLPHARRGITLRELWEFYDQKKSWLEELRWRCGTCHRSSGHTTGPCPHCQSKEGQPEMRNLYEVNAEMIKPACMLEQVSFVENLVLRHRAQPEGKDVDVFVSHWWGEAFPKFVRALDRYAKVRSAAQAQWWWRIAIMCIVFVLSPVAISAAMLAIGMADEDDVQHFGIPSCLNIMIVLTVPGILVLTLRGKHDPMETSFWICALANNQYAIDHAIDEHGDLMSTSFAAALQAPSCKDMAIILDPSATIYRRVWCAFEFFFAKVILPQKMSKHMEIVMTNDHGVVSDGDASRGTIESLYNAISNVRIADADASHAKDKANILRYIEEEHACTEDIDSELCRFAQAGVHAASVRRRAPCAIFLLGPLSGIATVYGIKASTMQWVECETDALCFENLAVVLSLSVLGPLLMVALVCCLVPNPVSTIRCRSRWSAHTRRVVERTILAITAFVAPAMLVELSCAAMGDAGFVVGAVQVMCWGVLFFVAGLAVFFGIAYYGAREVERFGRIRRYVEDTFLA